MHFGMLKVRSQGVKFPVGTVVTIGTAGPQPVIRFTAGDMVVWDMITIDPLLLV